ncbi:hypothetical protein BRAS3809_5750003 [Bradyrhizobium sp. STM 3809]|nr:hypothetical protein BRAS3809_5750003 [Bradyrhizobium sp. STM 3809]
MRCEAQLLVIVMPGLDPGIHPLLEMDGRVKPGHDGENKNIRRRTHPWDCSTARWR